MTDRANQARKAEQLRSLHHADQLLLLPNIWNPLGARILEKKGFPAVATASAAIGPSLGYQDGEQIKRSTLLSMLQRIASSVSVPVTADYEAGYGETLSELETSIRSLIESGVVGINFEDTKPSGGRWTVEEMAERVALVRQVSESMGVPLVINARPDSFLTGMDAPLEDAVSRAFAYLAAGADCIYPIGPRDVTTVRALRDRIEAPINVLGEFSAETLQTLHKIGVNRVSLGPFVFRATMHKFINIVDHLSDLTSGDPLPAAIMGSANVGDFLHDGPEQ